jgi:MFS family permease
VNSTRRALYLGVGIVSFAVLVLQITLTRLYSALYGNHLAFLAISLSLFGVGLGGVLVFVFARLADDRRFFSRMSVLSVAAGASAVSAVIYLLNAKPIEKLNAETVSSLAWLYAVSSLPFVFAGIIVAAALRFAAKDVSRLYFFDLLGAAAGGVGAILALRAGAPRAFLIVAVLLCVAAWVFARAGRSEGSTYSSRVALIGLSSAVLLLGSDIQNPWLKLPALRWVPMDKVEFQKWSEMSLITVDKPEGGMAWMRMDGSAATAILSPDTTPPLHPDEMAYVLHESRGPALVIGSGGGRDIRAALKAGQTEIYGAEINPTIVNHVMLDRYLKFSGGLYQRPEVHVSVADGRSFVRSNDRHYRNIVISLVDTWAAASVGALSLSENSLYTVEAFRDFIQHLVPQGTLIVNRWDAEFERLLALGVAGLRAAGATEPSQHLFACGHSRSTSLLIKRTAYAPEEIAALRAHCQKHRFIEQFAPDRPKTELRRRISLALDARTAAPEHKTDLAPPTDDRPFFFYTVPTRRLLVELKNYKGLEAQNQGLLSLVGLLCASVIVSVPLTLGPLFLIRRRLSKGPRRVSTLRALVFFSCIGAGFVFVEVALVQNFVLFLGHPVYALSTVLVALLAWTGVGSWLTSNIAPGLAQEHARLRSLVLCVLLLVAALGLSKVLGLTVGAPLVIRMLITLVLLAPLGILMGSQAPLAIRLLGEGAAGLIPWCWGLNGLFSVLATALGTLFALHLGFSSLLLAAAAVYALGFVVVPRLVPAQPS